MSKGRTQPPELLMAATLMGQTQVMTYTRPSFNTTVFRLPGAGPHRQQSLECYAKDSTFERPAHSLHKTIESSRTTSPERQDYNDLLRKYRDRLKQERKKHLKQLDEQANYCIRGGHLHNRMNLKQRNDSTPNCPKLAMDYEKVYRIINDIRNKEGPSNSIADELSKLPFLRKRHLTRHHKPIAPRIAKFPDHQRSRSCNQTPNEGTACRPDEPELVPWRSINEQDEEGGQCSHQYYM